MSIPQYRQLTQSVPMAHIDPMYSKDWRTLDSEPEREPLNLKKLHYIVELNEFELAN